MTDDCLHELIELINASKRDPSDSRQLRETTQATVCGSVTSVHELLISVAGLAHDAEKRSAIEVVLEVVATEFRRQTHGSIAADVINDLDTSLPIEHPARRHLLRLLASCPSPENLQLLAELFAARPPASIESIAVCLAALIKSPDVKYECLFPRMLDAVQHPHIAAAVLDLANFLVRSGRLSEHPAKPRAPQLIELLGKLAGYLGQSEDCIKTKSSLARIRTTQVSESIELAVALCDAIGLMREPSAAGKLFQILDLSHRRLRVEAAAALVALGEEAGVKHLVELASEPLVRLRVLAYASELDLLERIEPRHQSPAARAQAELIVFLSEPTQFGFPPATCELHDRRELYWPGYDGPVECFLFRFGYLLEHGVRENIGIAGPLTHVFSADVTHFTSEDIYAAFAGWQAEHEEIKIIEINAGNATQRAEVSRFERRLRDAGYAEVAPAFLGSFFGERSLVARAMNDGVAGTVIVEPMAEFWFEDPNSALSTELCYDIHKGRKVLESFNTIELNPRRASEIQ